MNNLNGWQRAWIVTAVVWAAVVMLFAKDTPPNSPMRLKELKDEAAMDQIQGHFRLSREELLGKQKGSVPEWDDTM